MRLLTDEATSLDDWLIVPQYSELASRQECSTQVKIGQLALGVPIFAAAMDTITSAEFAYALGVVGGATILHRFCTPEDQAAEVARLRNEMVAIAAIGIHDTETRARLLVQAGVDALVVDVAHCDTKPALEKIAWLRKTYPDLTLIAGTVATPEAAKRLVEVGVDGVRVGVGTGGACLTRTVAGVGVPQFSALTASASVCRPHRVAVLSDGGTRTSADLAKAIGAGASAVVVGKLFAETVEAVGPVVGGKRKYYGMATHKAAKIGRGLDADRRSVFSRGEGVALPAEEGTTVTVEVTRTVAEVVADLAGGLRSAMSYSASRTIEEFHSKVVFQRISSNARWEGNAGTRA